MSTLRNRFVRTVAALRSMDGVSLVCATPQTNKPAPKGAPEPKTDPAVAAALSKAAIKNAKKNGNKLPVPPRKDVQIGEPAAAAAAPKGKIDKTAPKTNGKKSAASVLDAERNARIDGEKNAPKFVSPTLVVDPKKDGIPVELQTQNRKPLTTEQKAKIESDIAAAKKSNVTPFKAATKTKTTKAAKNGKAKKSPSIFTDKVVARAVQMLKRKDGARSSEMQKEFDFESIEVRRMMRDFIRNRDGHKTSVSRDGRDSIYKIV